MCPQTSALLPLSLSFPTCKLKRLTRRNSLCDVEGLRESGSDPEVQVPLPTAVRSWRMTSPTLAGEPPCSASGFHTGELSCTRRRAHLSPGQRSCPRGQCIKGGPLADRPRGSSAIPRQVWPHVTLGSGPSLFSFGSRVLSTPCHRQSTVPARPRGPCAFRVIFQDIAVALLRFPIVGEATSSGR